mgnify:CR=1 FL=1
MSFPSILRITPAPAGKTKRSQKIFWRLKDHPRTCGENRFFNFCTTVRPGSPPHLRGKQNPTYPFICKSRITPAPAGKTKIPISPIPTSWDHPRTCGENSKLFLVVVISPGSPPHLRGKPTRNATRLHTLRITPAPAGKTFCFFFWYVIFQDHPRTCGENFVLPARIACT